MDDLRDDSNLVDDHAENEHNDEAPANLTLVSGIHNTSSCLNQQADVGAHEDTVLVEDFQIVSLIVLVRADPAHIHGREQTREQDHVDLQAPPVVQGEHSHHEEDSAK